LSQRIKLDDDLLNRNFCCSCCKSLQNQAGLLEVLEYKLASFIESFLASVATPSVATPSSTVTSASTVASVHVFFFLFLLKKETKKPGARFGLMCHNPAKSFVQGPAIADGSEQEFSLKH